MKRHLWTDEHTGVVTYFHDIEDGKFGIEQVQDVADAIEVNKKQANEDDGRWKGDGYHHVASIPPVIAMDLHAKGIFDDPKAFQRWLNDGDNRFFRVKGGTLG